MKRGDIVMFIDRTDRFAKHFYGRLATVESFTDGRFTFDGLNHVCVRWYVPVELEERPIRISDFSTKKFKVIAK